MALTLRLLLAALLATACAGTQPSSVSPAAGFPAVSAIREAELRADLFAMAGDRFRGREAGTLDELKASVWLAERARAAGLEPAGEDGTYFQFWTMRRNRLQAASRVAVDGGGLTLGTDLLLFTPPAPIRYDGPIVFVGEGRAADLQGKDLAGKVVVAEITAPDQPIAANVSLRPVRWAFASIGSRGAAIALLRPAAIILIADQVADSGFDWLAMASGRGSFGIDSTGQPGSPSPAVPILMARSSLRDRLTRSARIELALTPESFGYPSVNVVGRVRGTDPIRRQEYVLFSGHQDHDGVRAPVAGDSIYNGADDNASVSVALLAIGRAFAAKPAPRSALFVWHGAEERGLLGSRWHAAHPMIPLSSLVAVLNADMIGSNHPDTAALLGAQPPHRNSTELAAMGLEANQRLTRFVIDSSWDRPSHPEGWYFRSDHLPYARVGIPSLYFSSLPHPRYHTPKDEPEAINIAKVARIAQWMYATGWLVATAATRPALDPEVRLER